VYHLEIKIVANFRKIFGKPHLALTTDETLLQILSIRKSESRPRSRFLSHFARHTRDTFVVLLAIRRNKRRWWGREGGKEGTLDERTRLAKRSQLTSRS